MGAVWTHLVVGVVVYIRHALNPEPSAQSLRISQGAVGVVVAMETDHGWDGGGALLELLHVQRRLLAGQHQCRGVEQRRLLVHPTGGQSR